MNCPHDGDELVVIHRAGIEIDICPTCRGLWLDRGELDRALAIAGTRSRPGRPPTLPPLQSRSSAGEGTEIPAAGHAPETAPRGENWLADLLRDTPPR